MLNETKVFTVYPETMRKIVWKLKVGELGVNVLRRGTICTFAGSAAAVIVVVAAAAFVVVVVVAAVVIVIVVVVVVTVVVVVV